MTWEESWYLRVRSLRDRALSPLAALFAGLGIPPTALSLGGVAFAASIVVTLGSYRRYAAAAFAAALLCDAVDGAVARRTRRSSRGGKLVDQLCDTATLALLLFAAHRAGLLPPGVVAYGIAIHALLLALAVVHHSARSGPGWRLLPRGGFYAHFPRAIIYAAFAWLFLRGGSLLLVGTLVANAVATVSIVGFAGLLLLRPRQTPPPGRAESLS